MARIYLPTAGGMVDLSVYRVNQAITEYDERLYLDRNQDTGDWCCYIRMPHGEDPYPLFGWQELPHPEDAIKRLAAADTARRGSELLDAMNKRNAARKKELEYRSDQASDEAAERVEFQMRKVGLSPVIKSLRPRPRG